MQTRVRDNIEKSAGSLELLRPDGSSSRLATVWAERPVVLALVRHFGCIFCKEQVSALREIVSDIHDAGAELVIVGSGSPQMAGFFAEDYAITTPVLTDPLRAVYRALELRRPSRFAFLDPRALVPGLRAFVHGHRQQFARMDELGDQAQLGGVFIVRPGGDVAWAHRSAFAGDHPANDSILGALHRIMPLHARLDVDLDSTVRGLGSRPSYVHHD